MDQDGLFIHVAVAGSGKTRSLTRRARDLLLDGGDDPTNVVVICTYTREAAAELRTRVTEARLGEQVGRRLIVGTMHSISTQIVNSFRTQQGLSPLRVHGNGRSAYRLGEAILDVCQGVPGIVEELKAAGCPTDANVLARRVVSLTEIMPVDVRITAEVLRPYFRSDEVASFFALAINRWHELTHDAPVSDMSRIIPCAVRMLREAGADSTRWAPRHILVDESQDLSPVQIELVDALARRSRSLYLVGDPDQGIYRWRGGGEIPFVQIPECLQLSEHLAKRVVYMPPLDRSIRCPDAVASASVALLDHTEGGATTAIVGHDEGTIAAGWLHTEADEAAAIAQHISRISPSDFNNVAALARTHQAVEPVFFRLIAEQVPVRLMRADDPAMKQMLDRIATFLRVSLSPQNVDAAKAILRMRAEAPGLGIASVRKVEAQLTTRESAYQTLLCIAPAPGLRKPQVESIHQLGQLLKNSTEVLRRRGNVVGWLDWLVRTAPGTIAPPETENEDIVRVLAFAERLAVATSMPQRFLDVVSDAGGGNRVSVGTFHAAKGREWDTVFLSGLTRLNLEGIRERMAEKLFAENVLDGGDDGERRLLHVAMTRAARQVIMTWSGGEENASRFVRETGIIIPDAPGVPYRPVTAPTRHKPRVEASQQLSLF